MSATVLVTGATGFAGSHLMDALLRKGKRLRVLVRGSSNLRWIPHDQVEMVTTDIRDTASLHSLVSGISEVYHFGGLTRSRSPETLYEVNCKGTVRLARAFISEMPKGGLFLFCSSLAAAGPARAIDAPCREADSPNPITHYGKSKLAAEQSLENLFADSDSDASRLLIIRPPAIYGPRDDAILSFFRLIANGWLLLPTPPDSRVSLLHVRDLVEGCFALAEAGAAGTFYLDDGHLYSWEEIGEAIARAFDKKTRMGRVPACLVKAIGALGDLSGRISGRLPVLNRDKVLDILQPYWICDSQKARNLGYTPAVAMSKGMDETAQWYLENKWI